MGRKVKSAERTLALFELFSRRQYPLTVGRIADELEVPQPSVSMLLANLLELGYVTHDAKSRTYVPSIRIALLGSWIHRKFDEAGSLTARMTALQRQVDETVFLAIQNGAYSQYVLAMFRKKPRSMRAESGQHRLLTASAAGRALLAIKSDREILSWVHRCNAETPEPRLQTSASMFMSVIADIREQGYAQTTGDVTPTFGAIAMTVPAPSGLMPMAVGVGVPLERIDGKRDQIVRAIREFSETLSAVAVDKRFDDGDARAGVWS